LRRRATITIRDLHLGGGKTLTSYGKGNTPEPNHGTFLCSREGHIEGKGNPEWFAREQRSARRRRQGSADAVWLHERPRRREQSDAPSPASASRSMAWSNVFQRASLFNTDDLSAQVLRMNCF